MTIIIGIDPHKATHTAVAIGSDESELATVTVRATKQQTNKLLSWAEPFEDRTWAIESAGGLGLARAVVLPRRSASLRERRLHARGDQLFGCSRVNRSPCSAALWSQNSCRIPGRRW
ncbi:MAG: IS110 family transposase [Acidimicrobiales bacterium]